jgi:hypothetical protein
LKKSKLPKVSCKVGIKA